MRSSHAPLLGAAFAIALLGSAAVSLLGRAASQADQTPPEASSVNAASTDNSIITGSTHSETQPHSLNVIAAGNHHLEAQMSRAGQLEIYIYGSQEQQLSPIATLGLDLAAEAKAVIPGEESVPITLTPKPYSTDPDGMTSRLVGQFARRPDQEQVGLMLTLPMDDQTYRVSWRPENLVPGQFAAPDPGMPQPVSSDAARKLFLTPGGLYTQADIAANGNMTAKQKYGNQMSAHNAHPKPGDRLCPVTDTLANPKFAWIIAGKTYLFCCPPCIEEFVKRAKQSPASVKAPESYVKAN